MDIPRGVGGRADGRTVHTERLAREDRNRSSLFQLREHLACSGVALVGKPPQFLEVALLASELDQLVASGGVALVGKPPQFLEVAPLASSSMS
jgi:hypothetical protein